MSFILAAAEPAEHTRELPLDPYLIGALYLVFFVILLLGVLSYGKGRNYKR